MVALFEIGIETAFLYVSASNFLGAIGNYAQHFDTYPVESDLPKNNDVLPLCLYQSSQCTKVHQNVSHKLQSIAYLTASAALDKADVGSPSSTFGVTRPRSFRFLPSSTVCGAICG